MSGKRIELFRIIARHSVPTVVLTLTAATFIAVGTADQAFANHCTAHSSILARIRSTQAQMGAAIRSKNTAEACRAARGNLKLYQQLLHIINNRPDCFHAAAADLGNLENKVREVLSEGQKQIEVCHQHNV
jgi:hypothetical protein